MGCFTPESLSGSFHCWLRYRVYQNFECEVRSYQKRFHDHQNLGMVLVVWRWIPEDCLKTMATADFSGNFIFGRFFGSLSFPKILNNLWC